MGFIWSPSPLFKITMNFYPYIIAAIILAITYAVTRAVNKLIQISKLTADSAFYSFNRKIIVSVIYLIGIMFAIYSIPELRAWALSIMASVGILAIVFGFSAQLVLQNIMAGIFIAIFKPYKIGDILYYSNNIGIVEDINLRHTILKNPENNRIIVPNSHIASYDLINFSMIDKRIKKPIDFSIGYNSDIDTAKKIIKEEILNHPLCLDKSICEAKKWIGCEVDDLMPVQVIELGESSVKLRAWAWAEDQPKSYQLMCDVLESVKKRFDKEGIEIPYPHMTVISKK